MAFTHIVMFKWTRKDAGSDGGSEGRTDIDEAGLADALRTLVARFDGVRSYLCGADAGVSPNTYDFAIVGTFDDRESFMAYRDHPDHQKIVNDLILPHAESRVAVQLEQ